MDAAQPRPEPLCERLAGYGSAARECGGAVGPGARPPGGFRLVLNFGRF